MALEPGLPHQPGLSLCNLEPITPVSFLLLKAGKKVPTSGPLHMLLPSLFLICTWLAPLHHASLYKMPPPERGLPWLPALVRSLPLLNLYYIILFSFLHSNFQLWVGASSGRAQTCLPYSSLYPSCKKVWGHGGCSQNVCQLKKLQNDRRFWVLCWLRTAVNQ